MTRVISLCSKTLMDLDENVNMLLETPFWKGAEVKFGGGTWSDREHRIIWSAMLIRRESDGSKNLSRQD